MALTTNLDDIRSMAATRPFGMKSMNGSTFHCRKSVFNKTTFIKRIGMDHDLDIHGIRHA